ncbi:phospholipase, partial [Xanthomonas perforans]|nr:phospholipase [Xanthomonas perforans]
MSPSESSSSTPFAESMRGQQPHPEDRQLPAMLQDLYATAAQRREGGAETFAALPNGWSRMDDRALQQAGIDPALLHE